MELLACAANGQRRPKTTRAPAFLCAQCRYGLRNLKKSQIPMHRLALSLLLAFALTGCQSRLSATPALQDSLKAELVSKRGTTPPSTGQDICWANDVTPAIIETVTEQVLLHPEERGADGRVLKAAVFQTEASQRIVQDRRAVWFRTPCPEALTLDFVASLQRALKARGYYRGDLTGQLDAPTRLAIRQFQEPLGLDSERLSLAAAQRLGLSATEFKS